MRESIGVLPEFTTQGAARAAAAGTLEAWIDSLLRNGVGANVPMADGLRLQRRWWLGPILVPHASLTRICGPEPEMQYRTSLDAWETRVSAIAGTDEELPPLILEYRGTHLQLCDGNHRHEALRRRGVEHVWALVWFNSQADFDAGAPALLAHHGTASK